MLANLNVAEATLDVLRGIIKKYKMKLRKLVSTQACKKINRVWLVSTWACQGNFGVWLVNTWAYTTVQQKRKHMGLVCDCRTTQNE